MKTNIILGLLAATCGVVAMPAAAVTYTYVGSWSVGDGADWMTNPPVYSGQDAAALLFGGVASNYAISTLGSDPSLINFRAQVDGYLDDTYLHNGGETVSERYKLDTGGSGYNSNPGFGTAYSAYVRDHSGPNDPDTKNYAFRISGATVPEPASWAMMLIGFGGVGAVMRRRAIKVTFA